MHDKNAGRSGPAATSATQEKTSPYFLVQDSGRPHTGNPHKDTYLKSQRKGRKIIERNLDDYVHSNAVSKYVTNNTRCFVIPQGSTEIYKQSFFVKTISDWNRLRDNVVMAGSVEQFKTQLKI